MTIHINIKKLDHGYNITYEPQGKKFELTNKDDETILRADTQEETENHYKKIIKGAITALQVFDVQRGCITKITSATKGQYSTSTYVWTSRMKDGRWVREKRWLHSTQFVETTKSNLKRLERLQRLYEKETKLEQQVKDLRAKFTHRVTSKNVFKLLGIHDD